MRWIVACLMMACVRGTSLYQTSQAIASAVVRLCDATPFLTCRDFEGLQWVEVAGTGPADTWVLLEFGVHAREVFCGDLALAWLTHVQSHRPYYNVVVVPVGNPINRDKALRGAVGLRKMPDGVDPNRNYWTPAHHHRYRRDGEEYEGARPLTERNVRLVDQVLRQRHVETVVEVHTGEFSIYHGYDSTTAPLPNAVETARFAAFLAEDCKECAVGSAAKESSYKAYGTLVDWALQERGVRFAFTLETYGDWTRSNLYENFNPRTRTRKDAEIRRWIRVLDKTVASYEAWEKYL